MKLRSLNTDSEEYFSLPKIDSERLISIINVPSLPLNNEQVFEINETSFS